MDFESFGITREMLKEFEYIDECIYSTDLDEEVLEELEGCQCIQSCSQDQNCRCLSFCQAYTLEGLLQPGSDSGILECTSQCACTDCWNTVVQKNSKVRIKVVHSGIEEKGYQVIVLETISKGTFVAEYTGEILPPKEAKQRLSSNNFKNNYLLCIGEIFNDSTMITCIDARYYGNVSRFINHGCDPNLEIKLVRTGSLIPRFCLFAKRDISPSEELSYDYGIEYTTGSKGSEDIKSSEAGPVCYCGSKNCLGFLPSQTSSKTEFRRIDSNGDNALTFTEFLLGDRPYIETQSRNFHNLDKNSDGRVSREEFETFYRQQDEIHRRLRTDGFFKQLSVKASRTGTGPIVLNVSTKNETDLPNFFIKPFF